MKFELQLLMWVALFAIGGASGAALRSWMSTIQNSVDIQNLKERVSKLERQLDHR